MVRSWHFLMLGAALAVGGGAFAHADDKGDIKANGKLFADALKKNDLETARKYVVTDEKSTKFLDAVLELSNAKNKLTDAAVAKFGEDGKKLAAGGRTPVELARDFDEAEIAVNGDTAVVTPKTGKPVNFKKDGGTWKINFSGVMDEGQMAQALPFMSKMATAMSETATEIKDGKYATVQDAQNGMRMKFAAAMGFGQGGAPRQGAGGNRAPGSK